MWIFRLHSWLKLNSVSCVHSLFCYFRWLSTLCCMIAYLMSVVFVQNRALPAWQRSRGLSRLDEQLVWEHESRAKTVRPLAAQQAVRSDWKTADVDAQYIDADRALLGYGDFVLRPKYVRHRRTLQDWGRMTACQRSKAVDLCYRLPASSNVVTSTDGRLTVSSAPSGGRKPHQRKCHAADRTLTVMKRSWQTAAADRAMSQPTERDDLNITSFWQNHLTYLCINIFSEHERELTFTFAMLSSVRLSSVCLFVVCRSSVTLDHPTQAIVIFCTFSMAFGTLAVDIHKNFLCRSLQGNPSIGQRWASLARLVIN